MSVHGPFELNGAEIAKLQNSTLANVTLASDDTGHLAKLIVPAGGPSRLMPSGANDASTPRKGSPPPPVTPLANPRVVTGSAPVTDPQIAVGADSVVVTLAKNILLFKKADLKGQGVGANVNAQVITTAKFFSGLISDINQHLKQPKGYGVQEGYGVDSPDGILSYDARVLYDAYRKRFWIMALSITEKASPAEKETATDPVRQSACRGKILIGVSKGDDAFGGWYLYWWDGNLNEDTDPRITSTKYLSHIDYPLFGVSEKFLLVENRADVCPTGVPSDGDVYAGCFLPPSAKLQNEFYCYVTVAPADALAAGQLPGGKAAAFSYKDFKYPNGDVIAPNHSSGNAVAPAVHVGPVPFGVTFFANVYVDPKTADSSLMIWYLVPANPGGTPTFAHLNIPIRPVSRIGDVEGTVSAAFRGQELTVAFPENVSWPGCSSPNISAIRVVRVNVITNKVIIDSTTGRRSSNDPATVDCVGYFQPGIRVNKNGDALFAYMRLVGQTLEARYSVIVNASLAQPPSGLLQAGEPNAKVSTNYDTSAISLDPDDQAIWFAVPYESAKQIQIAIGRVWGQ